MHTHSGKNVSHDAFILQFPSLGNKETQESKQTQKQAFQKAHN